MPEKLGNAGHGLEEYDSNTGRYVADGKPNKYYDNPQENVMLGAVPIWAIKKATTGEKAKTQSFGDLKINQLDQEFAKKHGIKLIEGEHSIIEDSSLVNPNFSKWNKMYYGNCACCAMSYEMRRRGLDVEAKPQNDARKLIQNMNLYNFEWAQQSMNFLADIGSGKYSGGYTSWCYEHVPLECPFFKDEENNIIKWTNLGKAYKTKEQAASKIYNNILNAGEGARFILTLQWDVGNSGHALNAEVKNGEVIFVDSQSNKILDLDETKKYYFNKSRPSKWCYIRVDDKKLSDSDYYIKKTGKNAKIGDLAYKPR